MLASHPNIAACKEAGSDIRSVTDKAASERIELFCGNDTMLLTHLALGAKGAISVCSNIEPDRTCEIYEKYVSGDTNGAKEAFFTLYPFLHALGCDTNPVPIKAVMSACGLIRDTVRPPLCRLPDQKASELLYAAAEAGIYIK